MKDNNFTCKVVLVGDVGVGKTCIIERYIHGSYNPETESTITSTYSFKKVNFQKYNKSISFDIWDTAGQEIYRALAKNFYLNASIGILVYDITRRSSFEELQNYWYDALKSYGEENMFFAVVGNKCDLFSREEVKEEEAKRFAESINAYFILTSCKEAIGIEELFYNCSIKYLEQNKNAKSKRDKLKLDKKENAKKGKKKCY